MLITISLQNLFCVLYTTVRKALSKHQLAGALEEKTLTFQEKIKFLDYAEKTEKLDCRKRADVFNTGKTASSNILK